MQTSLASQPVSLLYRPSADTSLQGLWTPTLRQQPISRLTRVRRRRTEDGCCQFSTSTQNRVGIWRSSVCNTEFHTRSSSDEYSAYRKRRVPSIYDVHPVDMSLSSTDLSATADMSEWAPLCDSFWGTELLNMGNTSPVSITGEGIIQEPDSIDSMLPESAEIPHMELYQPAHCLAMDVSPESSLTEENLTAFMSVGLNEFTHSPANLMHSESGMTAYNTSGYTWPFPVPFDLTDSALMEQSSIYSFGLTQARALMEEDRQVNPFSPAIHSYQDQPISLDAPSQSFHAHSPPNYPLDQQLSLPIDLPGDGTDAARKMGANLAPKKVTDSPDRARQSHGQRSSPSSTRKLSQSSTDSNTSKFVCRKCGQVFKDHSGRTSLSRHKKYGRKDGPCMKDKITCSEPGCNQKFRRSDALFKHRKIAHGHEGKK